MKKPKFVEDPSETETAAASRGHRMRRRFVSRRILHGPAPSSYHHGPLFLKEFLRFEVEPDQTDFKISWSHADYLSITSLVIGRWQKDSPSITKRRDGGCSTDGG